MHHFIYPENQYKYERPNAGGTLTVEHVPDDDTIRATITKISGGMTIRLTTEDAAMLAGFILSMHPAIVKGDTMAFSVSTHSCDAIPEPDFAVIPYEWLAKPKEPDTKDDEQDTGELHPDQERRLTALREAAEILAGPGRLTHDRLTEWVGWILNGDTTIN